MSEYSRNVVLHICLWTTATTVFTTTSHRVFEELMAGPLVKKFHVTNVACYHDMAYFKFCLELVSRYGTWLQTYWMCEYTTADSQ